MGNERRETESRNPYASRRTVQILFRVSSYLMDLNGGSDAIINIAKERGVDAIIPGYGFLSENADFARAVAAAGMVFVGPSPESIESFGLKHTARGLATKAGVPVVPGSQGLIRDKDEAVLEAERLGFPVSCVLVG